ncbi:MAG: efflux RND transporter periplasmic adaptor subunit [bacterium]|nr:efflux RND transporter periplasmic adaptor subunit [bacterium]
MNITNFKNNKSRKTGLVILVVMILSFFAAGISCSKDGAVSPDEGYYTCSMHPQVIKQEPGICPICAMNLSFVSTKKNKKADNHKDHSANTSEAPLEKHFTFSLANDLIRNAKVETVPAIEEVFTRETVYSGHIDYNEDPNRLVLISTKYDGWIERLFVSKEGQWISKGKNLMGIYSQKILAAKEEYIITYKSLRNLYLAQGKNPDDMSKDPTLIASRRKLLYLDVPNYQVKQLEKTEKASRLTYFSSPISGMLVKKTVLQGQFIKTGQELFRIADLRVLWVYIHIFEKDIPFIKKGQSVSIETIAHPGRKFSGRIDLIYPFLDMKTRDIKVKIVVPNKFFLLKPGMFAKVKVKSKLKGKTITIPESAVIYSGDKNYVFLSLGDGDFQVRPVTVLSHSRGKTAIAAGLNKDDLVVANGQFLLDSEASLKESLEKGQMAGHQH